VFVLGASGFVAFAKGAVIGTGVGLIVVVVVVGAAVAAGLALLDPLDEHAASTEMITAAMRQREVMRKVRILAARSRPGRVRASVVVAVPLAVFGVPLLVASLDLLLPMLGRLTRGVRTEPAGGRARAVGRFRSLVVETPVPLFVSHGVEGYGLGVARDPVRYRSPDEDSGRWLDFAFRPGDIVISTRSKSGTTWMQMICALLIFQDPELPAPLSELTPWVDWLVLPEAEMFARLAAQRHRRFLKTHTPLDGIPLDERATYIVVARHPLDMAVSLYFHGDNLDRARIRELTGQPARTDAPPPRPPLDEWLRAWTTWEGEPRDQLDSLPGVMWHLSDAWARRDEANIVLVHYDDLSADLGGEMRRLAGRLDIEVPQSVWPALVEAATFEQMRARAEVLVPDANGVLKDRAAFFRRGSSGAGRELLSTDELASYYARTESMAPPDLLAWLHRA